MASEIVSGDPDFDVPPPAKFVCPHPDCGVYAHHVGSPVMAQAESPWATHPNVEYVVGWWTTQCSACESVSMWRENQMVYPRPDKTGPVPQADMPADVLALYEEAREVAPVSSRSAAALLRLSLERLVNDQVEGDDSLHVKIGTLVQNGMSTTIQRAMDVVRVVGNNAVHPGQIELDDDPDLVPRLFLLINLVVEQVITQPKDIDRLFDGLPEGARQAIEKRDTPKAQHAPEV